MLMHMHIHTHTHAHTRTHTHAHAHAHAHARTHTHTQRAENEKSFLLRRVAELFKSNAKIEEILDRQRCVSKSFVIHVYVLGVLCVVPNFSYLSLNIKFF